MNRTRAQRRTIARSGTEASGSYYQETTARRSNFQCGGSVMRHTIRVLFLLMAGLSTSTTMAQQVVGETICACQPGTYTMALQLNLTCGDRTIGEDITPGVNDTTCFIAPRSPGETVEDFVPTTVQEIQVFELDQLQDVVRSRVYESAFMDGDTVEYSSYVVSNPNNITATTLPKVLAVTLTARNAAGQPLLNTWAIRFDNDCGIYPVLTPGERIGWIRFVSTAN